jgi:hypothetical protein
VVRVVTQSYVAVAQDDWYQLRREDREGQFFRKLVHCDVPLERRSTRQGIYLLTPDGELLEGVPSYEAATLRAALRTGLTKWQQLPEARRKSGAVRVAELGKPDPDYQRTPPAGGLIVRVYARALEQRSAGRWDRLTVKAPVRATAARDHLWLREAEGETLLPRELYTGFKYPVPTRIAERLLRFHLIDNTRGEPPMWHRDEIRAAEMSLAVEAFTSDHLDLRLEGAALLAETADVRLSPRGYDARLLGRLRYDRARKAWSRFQILAVGDHWGEGRFTPGARPGRAPLGIAFELIQNPTAADQVPPQGLRHPVEYWRKGS